MSFCVSDDELPQELSKLTIKFKADFSYTAGDLVVEGYQPCQGEGHAMSFEKLCLKVHVGCVLFLRYSAVQACKL